MEMKGFVFTTDVFVGLCLAIIIIFAFVNLRFESSFPEKKYEKLNYFSEDLLNLVSHLKARGVSDKPTI
ncbi:MAG TPA: hypothetical protein VJ343_02230, partial [archaeon]|nr:hypothetical protein [archaeon]